MYQPSRPALLTGMDARIADYLARADQFAAAIREHHCDVLTCRSCAVKSEHVRVLRHLTRMESGANGRPGTVQTVESAS